MSRPKRKVILFLVEGASEREALSGPFEALIDEYCNNEETFFGYIKDEIKGTDGGDITSRSGVNPQCIEKRINKYMLSWVFDTQHIYPKDVVEVVQLTDLDGTYIPNSNIVPEVADDEAKNLYINDTIVTRNPQKTIERNKRKRENIDHLLSLSEIEIRQGTKRNIVPYSVYYFSSNLDHYLHNDANIESSRDKLDKARLFSERCVDDLDYFIKTFLCDPDGMCDMDYMESWDAIKKGTNSVNRHSNLGVLIKRLIQDN